MLPPIVPYILKSTQSMRFCLRPIFIATFLLQISASLEAQTGVSNFNMSMISFDSTGPTDYTMVLNGVPQAFFVILKNQCSIFGIYTYDQPKQCFFNNKFYYLYLQGLLNTTIEITSVHKNLNNVTLFDPICIGTDCYFLIDSHCSQNITSENCLDLVNIDIEGYPTTLSYYVTCDDTCGGRPINWSIIIEAIVVCVLVYLGALYSNAWSLGGRGLQCNAWFALGIGLIIVFNSLIGFILPQVERVYLSVLSFIFGILGVAICVNQVLFLFRIRVLLTTLFTIKTFEFRILEIISLTIGISITIGWRFSNFNIILNDILFVCISIACIKILKLVSLKIALLSFFIINFLQIAFSNLLSYINNIDYSNVFLIEYSYPFTLKIPTINPSDNQQCAWLPLIVIVFPGMVISYLRRFDSGRGTTLYLITAIATFFVGTLIWTLVILFSPIIFPFGLISGFSLFALTILFAYRRQELQVLWDGKFYDEEFVDRLDLDSYKQLIELQAGRDTILTIDSIIVQGLRRDSVRESNNEPKEEESSLQNNNIFEIEEKEEESESPVKQSDESSINIVHFDST